MSIDIVTVGILIMLILIRRELSKIAGTLAFFHAEIRAGRTKIGIRSE